MPGETTVTRTRLAAVVAATLLITSCSHVTVADDKELSQRFQITISSQMTSYVKDEKEEMVAETKLAYTLRRRGRQATLVFDSMSGKVVKDGRTVMDATLSRDKIIRVVDGKREV